MLAPAPHLVSPTRRDTGQPSPAAGVTGFTLATSSGYANASSLRPYRVTHGSPPSHARPMRTSNREEPPATRPTCAATRAGFANTGPRLSPTHLNPALLAS